MIVEIIKLILSVGFSIVVFSYYVLLIIKKKPNGKEKTFSSISIIIPAHNEEMYIKEAIQSAIEAEFNGDKEIIVVNDGSIDSTKKIITSFKGIKIIDQEHSGKSTAVNNALKIAKGELIAVMDGDSVIEKNSLDVMANYVSCRNVAACCCPVRVKNRKKFICMWLHLAEMNTSLIRGLLTKVNANITTPGPLSVYRRSALDEVNGFSTDVLSEDSDVAIKLIRKGYKIEFTEETTVQTNMPHTFKWFFLQRLRFARGLVKILKKHLRANKSLIDLYTMPILLFGYIQGIIMGFLSTYQIVDGYIKYFYSKGIIMGLPVLKYFFEWFSIVGFLKWSYNVFFGNEPLTLLSFTAVIATLLTYPFYIAAIIKYDKKVDIYHIIPFIFMYPFWLIMMFIQIISIPEMFRKEQKNIWKKND